MEIIIQSVNEISAGRMLMNLRHVKKECPVLRHYVSEITDDKYLLRDEQGNIVAEFDYLILDDNRTIRFENFRGQFQEEIKKMLMFNFVEMNAEKTYVFEKEKKVKLYYSLEDFWLIEKKKKVYKIGIDHEKIIEVELYHIPTELR